MGTDSTLKLCWKDRSITFYMYPDGGELLSSIKWEIDLLLNQYSKDELYAKLDAISVYKDGEELPEHLKKYGTRHYFSQSLQLTLKRGFIVTADCMEDDCIFSYELKI